MNEIPSNVIAFAERTAAMVGKQHGDRWHEDMLCQLVEGEIASPIEQLFFLACRAIAESRYVDFNPDPVDDKTPGNGLQVAAQVKVGNYRVDFVLSETSHKRVGPAVVVELDGHDFHDKDKKQRAYEKARDRFLVKRGYKVLHFTGSEVVKDPFAVAFEAIEATGAVNEEWDEYNPAAPLNWGFDA